MSSPDPDDTDDTPTCVNNAAATGLIQSFIRCFGKSSVGIPWARHPFSQRDQKPFPIIIITKDGPALIALKRDMLNRARKHYPWFSRHAHILLHRYHAVN
jgi:hypothetical protein